MNTENKKIFLNSLFFLIIIVIILPVPFYYYFTSQIESNMKINLSKYWKVSSDDKTKSIDINLPKDLSKNSQFKQLSKIIYEKEIGSFSEASFKEPLLLIGRIADSDKTYLNDCLIGQTGFRRNKIFGWSWSFYRAYKIPKNCLEQTNFLKIEVYKRGGPNLGIFAGKVGIGESDLLSPIISKIEIIRFYIPVFFGCLLIFGVGVYYLFIYLLIPIRIYNGFFSLCAFSVGFFEIMLSSFLYRIYGNTNLLMKLNAITAMTAATMILFFFRYRFFLFSRKKIYYFLIITFPLFSMIIFSKKMDFTYKIYEVWFFIFLLTFFSLFYTMVKKFYFTNKIKENLKYVIGFGFFVVACFSDIYSTSFGIGNLYLIPYGFVAFLGAATFALAEEYADAFLHVETLVDERTSDLASAIERLRALEQMKDKFFANISHDFKTPIAVAMGSLEEIKRDTLPSATIQRRAIISAESSLNKLLSMVGDLLDLIKAESGTLKMDWSMVDPAHLIKSWLSPYQVLANKKNLTIRLKNKVKNEIKIPMDVSKFERVVQNLLSNAIKFTDYSKEKANIIEIQTKIDHAWYYIEVHDSGMGIPDDEKPMVFERYYQTTKTSLKQHGGSGIGLSFVKEMVENQNGSISVKDSDYGGVKFVIALPMKQNVEVTGNYFVGIDDIALAQDFHVDYPRLKPKTIDDTKFTILVAEDNPEVANITLAALEKDFNVYMAPNGVEALKFIKENIFDCLVTDIVMPKMRGEELVKEVRQYQKTKDLPILVLSSQSDENTVIELLHDGANDYVTKPFKREILLARVLGQIEKHKSSQWISQNEKVIELGLLASGMAHQIRNGLHAMKNQISYYEKTSQRITENIHEMSDEQRQKMKLRLDQCNEMMTRALDRIDSLTASVNSYALSSKTQVEISLKDSLTLMQELLADKITASAVSFQFKGHEKIKFKGYTSFHEVIINLFANAMDACPHDGTGVISLKTKVRDNDIKIEIEDNGYGIKKEVLDKLCQPFFTTKAPGEGTGLGLYIVRDIVQGQHGGKLSIYSDGEGKGARFVIEIPKVAKTATQDADIMMHGHKV